MFPSLRTREFYNAYKDWDVNTTPSDVGLLSEKFRVNEAEYRSDQPTHSVSACGKDAKYITENHGVGEHRIGVFGNTPFSKQSPWQKMYDMGGKVVMIGVTMKYNTFKHFVEYKLVNDIINAIPEEKIRKEAAEQISSFSDTQKYYLDGEVAKYPDRIWFHHDALKMQAMLEERGLLNQTVCGESKIICFKVKDFVDMQYQEFFEKPEEWLRPIASEWVKKYKQI